ncbi:MAG: acylphosphatase [Clostridia bacterium]|nr:acylphosphatase [Clostridia bacterium]
MQSRERGNIIRKHFVFTGDVQGVGFRYRAHYAAQMEELTGWVMNRWDGAVEMEVQGTADAIERMIGRIAAGTYVWIQGREEWQIPLDEEESGFHVRYD